MSKVLTRFGFEVYWNDNDELVLKQDREDGTLNFIALHPDLVKGFVKSIEDAMFERDPGGEF